MEYFENMIKTLLEWEGYWVRQSFKVNLTKQEKREIGKPSIPRPEIDMLAFKPEAQEMLVIEAKSHLDSPGVRLGDLQKKCKIPEGRYKLFTCTNYRNIVFNRLKQDLRNRGMIQDDIRIKLGLVAGKIYQGRSEEIRAYVESNGWFFWSPEDVRKRVNDPAVKDYENDPIVITAKILMKGDGEGWGFDHRSINGPGSSAILRRSRKVG